MKPEFITFTGADNWTSIEGMLELSRKYPIEWGILFSPKRQGVDPRYPDGDRLSAIMWSNLRLSAHICGDYSDAVMAGHALEKPPVDFHYFQRVQVNHATPVPARINRFRTGWGIKRGIGQCRGNFPLDTSVDWLFDRSGGRGETSAAWPRHPGLDRLVGYAGGISPDNILDYAISVFEHIEGRYWIDMESGVRTNDRLDLEKCRQVCEQVYGGAT